MDYHLRGYQLSIHRPDSDLVARQLPVGRIYIPLAIASADLVL